MFELELSSVDVYLGLNGSEHVVNASPNEAMAMMTMPALAGSVTKLVPHYTPVPTDELSKMCEEEN